MGSLNNPVLCLSPREVLETRCRSPPRGQVFELGGAFQGGPVSFLPVHYVLGEGLVPLLLLVTSVLAVHGLLATLRVCPHIPRWAAVGRLKIGTGRLFWAGCRLVLFSAFGDSSRSLGLPPPYQSLF